jgi:hydrogenase maturation protein HypF
MVRGAAEDARMGRPAALISVKFHNTLIRLMAELCDRIAGTHGVRRVVLSGGVFQNVRLLTGLIPVLQARGLEVFSHRRVPTNDGGIALGQAVVAAALS